MEILLRTCIKAWLARFMDIDIASVTGGATVAYVIANVTTAGVFSSIAVPFVAGAGVFLGANYFIRQREQKRNGR